MREASNSYIKPPPPPLHPPKSNLPMLYYGLVVVGTTAIVLALYNLIIIKWCTRRHQSHQQGQRPNRFVEAATASHDQSLENMNINLLSSFKYKKDKIISTGGQEQEQEQGSEHECAVCLSVFEDGEEVRQLPRCKHSFHAPCIDMWLSSHSDCPLCRAAVDITRYNSYRNMNRMVNSQDHSRENLLN